MTALDSEPDTTTAADAFDARRGLVDAVTKFLRLHFPAAEDAALVLEPAPGFPPVVLPVRGVIPCCVQPDNGQYVRMSFTPSYSGRPFDMDDATGDDGGE